MIEDLYRSKRAILVSAAIFSLVISFALPAISSSAAFASQKPDNDNNDDGATKDVFGIKEFYPTKHGGREWFLDMKDPASDGVFDPRTKITKNDDGSWRVSGEDNGKYQVRMNVRTPHGEEEWQNVEITGYAKVVKTMGHADYEDSDLENVLQWYARSGEKHSTSDPCQGTSIKGRIHLDGHAGWKKELWHAGGYTNEKGVEQATTSPLALDPDNKGRYHDGKWFGWKVVIYNMGDGDSVKMESYIDEHADNNWKKVSELVDDGGWYASSSDSEFYSANCGKEKDHVLTESGQVATFRSDKLVWDFKDLSVREIEPPQ